MEKPEAPTTPAVGSQLVRGVRPVAWADDKVMAGQVGNCASDAAKTYWQRSNQFGRMMADKLVHPLYDQGALDAALNLWPRDCRLCAHFRDGLTQAAHCVSVLRCEDSSAYRATQPVQFWEKRPAEPAPF